MVGSSHCVKQNPHTLFVGMRHPSPRRHTSCHATPPSPYSHLPDPANFSDPDAADFAVAIVGDLHLSNTPKDLDPFIQARTQLHKITTSSSQCPRLVQLGDLGSYDPRWPGSTACFTLAQQYLAGFNLPVALTTGNHDLEGDEFETDEENLAAWHQAFKQRHYWACDLGPATLIGLSTVRFRSNLHSVHEVHIDDEQLQFLEKELERTAVQGRPVILCTHAPILGSGLKAIQAVHVKNRCAWLNHSSNPRHFINTVQKYPHIRLWFSGHFHLSQSYPDSVSVVGTTAYVLTGVIGDHASRDGLRHSRLLKGNANGFEVYTVDHDTGTQRLDLRGGWEAVPPQYMTPEDDLLCDPSSGWLCSQVDCTLDGTDIASTSTRTKSTVWFNAGPRTMLTLQDDILVEYDVSTMAPIGAVFLNVPENGVVRLVDVEGREVDVEGSDGSAAVAVEIVDEDVQEVVMRQERNAEGLFYSIFQPNKWVLKKKKEAEERKRGGGGGTAPSKPIMSPV